MSRIIYLIAVFFTTTVLNAQTQEIQGISEEVTVYRDVFGINHIYAENENDLFFAQGYCAAKDRLFQFEIWRRQATGTIAEILGYRELSRDIGTRLFQFRGNMDDEMNHYHPRGKSIIESFVEGVNAYINLTLENPDLLPMEFQLLDIKPGLWTPEIVISRHQGLLRNIERELDVSRLVTLMGADKVKEISWFHPQDPDLQIDESIESDLLFENILSLYNAFRRSVQFTPDDVDITYSNQDRKKYHDLAAELDEAYELLKSEELNSIGSNNWVVSGDLTQSGFPMMANDPHRTLAIPSLRYMVHLVAPGWNVIGGGEPEIPGVSIGHNDFGAWGLTVYNTDSEDLYYYETNPDNPNQYKYRGRWENMTLIDDTIKIKGSEDFYVTHRYTRHGPVVFQSELKHAAFAVRCGWLEIGGSPYLASLRMDQAQNWEEFRDACNYSNIPGENMVWADREGHIGWQAVGIAPIRRNFSGMVVVPGDGRYEWDGYLPIIEKPSIVNNADGIIITANENVTPGDYDKWDAIGFTWSDPFRGDRLAELIDDDKKHSMQDMISYQVDYLSIPARQIIPLLRTVTPLNTISDQAKYVLENWDFKMNINSIAASIYNELENRLKVRYEELHVPLQARSFFSPQMKKVIDWLIYPDESFGSDPIAGRDSLLAQELSNVTAILRSKLGEITNWQYGQKDYKHAYIRHPLSLAVNDSIRKILDVGPVARGGYGLTVGNTSNNLNQRSGASFRIIVDTENWDHSVAMNGPGQSGDPTSPFYNNLFKTWARDGFFPLYFSKEKVVSNSLSKFILKPE